MYKLKTSYMVDNYIFECKETDLFVEVGLTIHKHENDLPTIINLLKDKCNIYKIVKE